ncbi:hypothetical protein ACE7GA_04860 [Roseomonas sp. CCTCC AB2023176]|uniref:hypothetical protein n=1 Tax=Roseomonas sp. CCTCC AB2023176 TaxID=3342640 RepID=UPI0035DF5675
MWPYGAAPEIALLCPVPALHLAAIPLGGPARQVAAFGTDSAPLWTWVTEDAPVIRPGAQVFIFPTVSRAALPQGSPAADLMRSGAHTARRAGRFRRLIDATPDGTHPDEAAPSAPILAGQGDDTWTMFWEVDEFVECRIRLDAFRTYDRGRKFAPSFKLHGPTLARIG